MAGEVSRTDERVRVRAYHLWEQAGRPHGRNEEFWDRAYREVLAEIDAERAQQGGGGNSGQNERP